AAVEKRSGSSVVTVGQDICLHGHALADDPLGGKATAIDLRFDVLDDGAQATFPGFVHPQSALRFGSHLRCQSLSYFRLTPYFPQATRSMFQIESRPAWRRNFFSTNQPIMVSFSAIETTRMNYDELCGGICERRQPSRNDRMAERRW